MTKKNKIDDADDVSELLELAQKLHLEEGFLDDEIHDVFQTKARAKEKRVQEATLMGQLEFLLENGYSKGRLKELIEEAAK